MKFITANADKFEVYHINADGTATKIYTAKTRESAVEKIKMIGATEIAEPETFRVRKPQTSPRLDTFAGMVAGR